MKTKNAMNENTQCRIGGLYDYYPILDAADRARDIKISEMAASLGQTERDWLHQNLRGAYALRHSQGSGEMYLLENIDGNAIEKLDDAFGDLMVWYHRYDMLASIDTREPRIIWSRGSSKIYVLPFTWAHLEGRLAGFSAAGSFSTLTDDLVGHITVKFGNTKILFPTNRPFPKEFDIPEIDYPMYISDFSRYKIDTEISEKIARLKVCCE